MDNSALLISELKEMRPCQLRHEYQVTIDRVIQQIEQLSTGQFRWIPVSERLPTHNDGNRDGDVFWKLGRYTTAGSWNRPIDDGEFSVHWAPIPPLPEPPAKTQEEKDEELFEVWWQSAPSTGPRSAYLAGLKAAREAKP